ncbi:scavenger receptor cysteine-rich type 1 protein M130-like [Mytilus californianus]|uniref:scavenger receptor cysteine-rich type 1 protein M130-like n=1 Tax=Mytilus californianus TaxID=6549 RepID=UPI002247CE0B|nr:scavenger receptor cysteine-rich type 1 protein M130-like [Mytilus californianus]
MSNFGIGENNKVVLRCKVRSDAEPNFEWVRIDNSTSAHIKINGNDDGRYSIYFTKRSGLRYGSKLVIRNTQASDSGIIKCRVNVRWSTVIERQFRVHVQEYLLTPIRLESYTQEGEGIVQIRHKNKWTYFYYYDFSTVKASMACRSLGYPYGGVPRITYEEIGIFRLNYWRHKKNKNPMCIGGISCLLNVTDIGQCKLKKPSKCFLAHVVGVTCRLEPVKIPDVPIRLMIPGKDIQNLREGVVEVFLNDHWGFVLGIEQSEVNVFCKTLGFEYGGQSYKTLDVLQSTQFGRLDITNEILQNFSCPENASHLNECSDMEWTERSSFGWDRWNILSIRCWTYAEINDSGVQIRLAGLNIEHEGRVEILHNNIWGIINDRWFDYPGANVLCKMIGYQYGGVPIYNKYLPGLGPLWIDYIECPLIANDLKDCEFDWTSEDKRVSFGVGPAVVKCRTEPVEVPEVKFRLKEGWRRDILQYFKDGYWGYVCGAYMGTSEATVFCQMLGFTKGGHIINDVDNGKESQNYHRTNVAPTILKYIECPWNSVHLDQCSERKWSHKDNRIICDSHKRDLRLKCRSTPFPEYEVQLFGGNSTNEGELLVKYDNTWTTVHSHKFPTTNVAVVCRQLGFRHGREENSKDSVYMVHENSPFWLIFKCNGKEQNVGQCNSMETQPFSPFESQVSVFIKCYEKSDPELQMTVSLESDGKVIVHRQGETWEICSSRWSDFHGNSLWDDVTATAVCRMLNKSNGTATHLPFDSRESPATANNIQQVYCPRGASHLGDCFYGRLGFKDYWFSPWAPGDCNEAVMHKTYRGGVQCSI